MGLGRININKGTSTSINKAINETITGNLTHGPNDGTSVNFKQLEKINEPTRALFNGPKKAWETRTSQEWLEIYKNAKIVEVGDVNSLLPPGKDDWWGSSVEDFNPEYVLEIVCLETGRSLNMYLMSKGNHSDVIPASIEDTALFRDIFGNEESFVQRPILVIYDGNVIISSIHTNNHHHGPSGNDFTIQDPNWTNPKSGRRDRVGQHGHVCIHFDGTGVESSSQRKSHYDATSRAPDLIASHITNLETKIPAPSSTPPPTPKLESSPK